MKYYIFCLVVLASCYAKKPDSRPLPNNRFYNSAIKFSKTQQWVYDASYYPIAYPNGDVPSGGACTDVVIRVLRDNGIDLQKQVHEDISLNFDQYPNRWGLTKPDPNIDHRRVYNLMVYFRRAGYDIGVSDNPTDYQPGDIICWELAPGITHTGIALTGDSVYHNIGPQAQAEDDFLFRYKIIGHYRIK